MAENFKCSGNCLNCMPAQRAYCASQHAYSNMKVLDQLMEAVMAMQSDVKNLREKIEAIQNNEASVFDPNLFDNKTQSGDGAKIDAPKQLI